MKLNGLVLVIFSLFFRGMTQAQSPAACLTLARQAYANENYSHALELYERVVFFERDSVDERHFEQIGRCYIALRQFDSASVAFQTSAALVNTDSMRAGYFLKSAWCQLMHHAFQDALLILYNLPNELPQAVKREKNFYIGVATFQLGQFNEAQQSFRRCFSDPAEQQWVDSLFEINARLSRRYNPRTARMLSILLPGSGHFYAGDVKSGLNSLALLAGIVALGINYMTYYTWFDSLISVAPWFQRYYFGGFKRASQATIDKREQKRMVLLKQLIEH